MRLNVSVHRKINRKISGTRVKFLRQWIPAKNWCRSVSRMYHFDNATGQVTVKHAGWYWVYGQVSAVLQYCIGLFHRRYIQGGPKQ